MIGFLSALFLATGIAAAAPAPPPAAPDSTEPWPSVRPAGVIRAPNWTDYAIYPPVARRRGQEGRVVIEALIGRDGIPRTCRIVSSSGHAELDNGTCDIVQTMRFAAPVDGNGSAVESTYRQPFAWFLTDAKPFVPTFMTASLILDGGNVTGCTLGGGGPLLANWSRSACRAFSQADYYLGEHRFTTRRATIEVELTPNGIPPLTEAAPGTLVARRHTDFQVSVKGDPVACRQSIDTGFGSTPRIDHRGPCGFFLTGAWFKVKRSTEAPPSGSFEVRVYVTRAAP